MLLLLLWLWYVLFCSSSKVSDNKCFSALKSLRSNFNWKIFEKRKTSHYLCFELNFALVIVLVLRKLALPDAYQSDCLHFYHSLPRYVFSVFRVKSDAGLYKIDADNHHPGKMTAVFWRDVNNENDPYQWAVGLYSTNMPFQMFMIRVFSHQMQGIHWLEFSEFGRFWFSLKNISW